MIGMFTAAQNRERMAAVEADDGQAPSCVTDHCFASPEGQPWARCIVCSLSEAAHIDTTLQWSLVHGMPAWLVSASYRCPYCVHREVAPCLHGRRDGLDIKAQPLGGPDGLR